MTEVREEKTKISREEARKLALFKLTGNSKKPPLKNKKKKFVTQRTVRTAFERPPMNLLPEPCEISEIKNDPSASNDYILDQDVKFP